MASRFHLQLTAFFVFFGCFSSSTGLVSTPRLNPTYPKAISDLKEAIVRGLGFQADDIKVSGFDTRDALVGHSVAYEFDVEIDNKVLPLKLLEDVSQWEYVDLPIFQVEDSLRTGEEKKASLVEERKPNSHSPVLEPFQLAGPMELWIQDAKDIRLSLPHDVDAGVLKRVILADGAVVTVKGARSVSLRHPLDLPLPLNRSHSGLASGLLTLADRLHHASCTQDSPLLSLVIVGPTSLTSPSSSSSNENKLKLKRLGPGLVELSSPSKVKVLDITSAVGLQYDSASTMLTSKHFPTMWPVVSINASNANLRGFEALLTSVLGRRANKEGSFKLLKADVSAETFVKIGFSMEKKLKEGDGFNFEGFPKWRTKPEAVRMHFEVLGKVDGKKVVPEKIMQVNPVEIEDTVASNVLMGNTTTYAVPIVHPPPISFTL